MTMPPADHEELVGVVGSSGEQLLDLAGAVRSVTTEDWPTGYLYGATRFADVILRTAFPERYNDLVRALMAFTPTLDELRTGGGGRTPFVKRFDDSLHNMRSSDGSLVWGKQNVTIDKVVSLDGADVARARTRGHEIDMFGRGTVDAPVPGIAVEMEWNNKDPFYDRDLISFQALHREGAIAVGVVVTRGPRLQELIGPTIRSKDGGLKFGQSTTHWSKLLPKVGLGGGGECPLLLVGIEPERVVGVELAERTRAALAAADTFRARWRDDPAFTSWQGDARSHWQSLRKQALDLMPPLADAQPDGADD